MEIFQHNKKIATFSLYENSPVPLVKATGVSLVIRMSMGMSFFPSIMLARVCSCMSRSTCMSFFTHAL